MGLFKKLKKVFRKVAGGVRSVLKKVAKPLMIAAAIYFTAGLALSAFPATSAFAAAMPGFGGIASTAGAGAPGALAGTGLSGVTVAANAAATLPASIAAASTAAGTAVGAGISTTAAQGLFTKMAVKFGLSGVAQGSGIAGAVGKTGMALSDKLLLASTVSNTISGLTGPSEKDIIAAQRKFHGSFYGMGGGDAERIVAQNQQQQQQAPAQGQPAAGMAPGTKQPATMQPSPKPQPMQLIEEPSEFGASQFAVKNESQPHMPKLIS
jgi:hypothetical protein